MPAHVPTFLSIIAWTTSALASIAVHDAPGQGGFALVAEGHAATIVVNPEDHRVATLAATSLAEDVERVSGQRPAIANARPPQGPAVIVGSLERSDERNRTWQPNVLRNSMTARTSLHLRPGKHMLCLWGLDPSVAVQGVTIVAPLD